PVTTTDGFALLTSDQQSRQLRLALVSLEEDLDSLRGGEGWKKYLHLRSLLRLIASQPDNFPVQSDRVKLQTIADQYDEVQRNETYRTISQLWGFQMLRNGLRAYAAEPNERDRQLVRAHAARLQRSLNSVQRGSGWIDYFQLDDLVKLAQSKEDPSPAARKILSGMSERLDEVAKNPDYRKISQMNGFEATRLAVQQLATSRQQLAQGTSRDDSDQVERVVRTIQQTLDELSESRRKEEKARLALATVQSGTSEADKTREILKAIKQRHDEEMKKAAAAMDTLLAAIKRQRQRDEALQTLSLASQQGLEIIKKLQAYEVTDDAMGFKVLKKRDGSGAMETKTLTPADRQRAQNVMKRLTLYRQQDCAGRLQLVYPKRDDSDRASGTKKLADRDRIKEIVKKMFEQNESETEYILMQFENVPEPEEVTLMQFEDVEEPPEYILMQFEDVPEPDEVTVMQFSEVTEQDEDEGDEDSEESAEDAEETESEKR
ncbi:MAG: hypothetical protein OES79_15325, partial [Planctomycetota bacterium]|nr:hypothetical protein [Planctomycetota bacterium]